MSAPQTDWRGVAAENQDVVTAKAASLMQARSRALLGSLLRPYKRRLWIAGVLIVTNTLADLSVPFFVGRGVDAVARAHGRGFPHALVAIIVAMLIAMAVEATTNLWFVNVVGLTTQDVLRDLRMRCFAKFQQLSLAFYERYTSGRVIARMTSDIDSITELLATGFNDLVENILSLVGITVFLLWLDLPLALATLAVVPIVLVISRWFRNRAVVAYRSIRRTVALVIVHFVESLGGIRAVQAFRREPRNQQIMHGVNDEYSDANVESIRLLSIFSPALAFIGRASTAIVIAFGGWRVVHGQVTIGVLVSFIFYMRRFFDPMQELSQVYNLLQASAAALTNLSGILEEEPSVPEPMTPKTPAHVDGAIAFERVTFAYRDRDILHDLSLAIPAGQVVALVGQTGAGKTTIARLVARFWDPSDGCVTLDGVDLRDIPDDVLRRSIAMVTQESFLFGGTVADNIALGRPDARREEVIAAARALGAHEFISALPEGYDTDVRKRGGRLSAGQRQLVSFARAFLADPAVLILDEATSSLDIPSERLVQRALRTLLAGRTAFIIAHRLSTVEIADRVLVIDAGRIVEDGAPSELIGGAGAYASLHAAWLESLA